MIEPGKLFQLEGGQKRRKLALTYGALERDIRGIAEKGTEYSFENIKRSNYLVKITEILLKDPKLEKDDFDALSVLIKQNPLDELRLCNVARNTLLKIIGTFPAEWDLVIAPHAAPTDENGTVRQRSFYPGVCVYAEDIRSPFNIGSILELQKQWEPKKYLFRQIVLILNNHEQFALEWAALKLLDGIDVHYKIYQRIYLFLLWKQAEQI